jgi:hypothetical protein
MPTDTFTVASNTDDGSGYRTDTVWANVASAAFNNADGSFNSMTKSLFTGDYYVHNFFLRFDTSSLPDAAVITAADLLMYLHDRGDPDNVDYAIDFYDFGGEPSVAADWELTSSGDAVATVDASALTIGVVNTIPLTGLAGISLTAITGLRGAQKNSVAPTGDNYVDFTSWALGLGAGGSVPQLRVTYTVPAAATVFQARPAVIRTVA